ncbi:MAG TPA: hypothetical protein VHY59_06715 [Chthoniobacterales bacterium]|nr:hypothetical protein [Chthoniobacterales bacterium]
MADFYSQQNQLMAGEYSDNSDAWPLGVGTEARGGHHPPDSYSGPGHPLYVFPGYGVNQARNNGTDLEPIPITPVKHQNWPEMQVQLDNIVGRLNFGRKMGYDDYLRLLTSSNEKTRSYLTPGVKGGAPGGNVRIGPSPLNIQSTAQGGPGAQPSNPGGPGQLAGSFTNGGFYG